jgi:hypothetical protein
MLVGNLLQKKLNGGTFAARALWSRDVQLDLLNLGCYSENGLWRFITKGKIK